MCENKEHCCNKLELPGDSSLTPLCCKTESQTISRQTANDIFLANWCVFCGETTEFNKVPTHLPGIIAANCGKCNKHFHINMMESDEDQIRIPMNAILPA